MGNNPSKAMLLFIILSITSLVFGVGAVTPALADIAKAFPKSRHETIQMIATVPALLIMVSTLVCGQLSRRMRKKTLVLIGMSLYGIGGILPAFWGGIPFILAMRGVFGIGCGFIMPLSQGLIADFFQGRDRDVFMGYRSSAAAIFGMIFTYAGGTLCAIHWRHTFFSYLLVIPVFLVILFLMPEPERQATAASGEKGSLTPAMWFYVAMYFLYNVTMMCFITNAAFVMSAAKVGDAGAIAKIMMIQSVGGILAGFLLGTLTRGMKNFTLVFALGFLALAFVILNIVNTAIPFAIACAIWGFGFGTFNPAIALKVIGSVSKADATRALAILNCALGVGQFISPHVYSTVNGWLGLVGPRASWMVAAACFVAAFVVSLVVTALNPMRLKLRAEEKASGTPPRL
jgi:MFS family permease